MNNHSQKKEKLAVLDCGTNTFNLLIVESSGKNLHILHQQKIPVRLGKNGLNERMLHSEAIERAINALKEYSKIIQQSNPDKIFVSATSAVRTARNGHLVREACLEILGQPMHLISGPEEAKLIFRGVLMSGVLDDVDSALIVDIGGGSCEFILYYHKAPIFMESFEIGVSRLTDDFATHDKPEAVQLSKMNDWLDNQLNKLFNYSKEYLPQIIVGSSGTFDTFADMLEAEGKIIRKSAHWCSYKTDDCRNLCQKLTNSSLEERLKMPGITSFRAEMLPASAMIMTLLTDYFRVNEIRTSEYAIKEGILFSLMHNKRLP